MNKYAVATEGYEFPSVKHMMQVYKDNISEVAMRSGKSEADVYEAYLEIHEQGSLYFEWVW